MGSEFPGVKAASASSIEISFYYKGQKCRERIRLKPTPANLKRAARHREAILDAIDKGTFDYSVTFPDSPRAHWFLPEKAAALTVREYMLRWLDEKAPSLKASTLRDYKKIVHHKILPEFGDTAIEDLKRHHVKSWVAEMDCGQKRISNIISPLRAALQDAVDDELLDHNPLAGWHFKKREAPARKEHVDPFTADEQRRIIEAAGPHGANLIQFAFWSGLRTSELVALEWGDVDLETETIRVSRAKTQAAEQHEETKTRAGTRSVKMLPLAKQALMRQKSLTYLQGGVVFFNPRTGQPWAGDQAIRKTLWHPALKKAGVRYRFPYQTRHTYGSMMLSAGEPLAWVSQQMGHSSIFVTTQHYARWIPESDPLVGNKAHELFGREETR